jgi:hypothetical protein
MWGARRHSSSSHRLTTGKEITLAKLGKSAHQGNALACPARRLGCLASFALASPSRGAFAFLGYSLTAYAQRVHTNRTRDGYCMMPLEKSSNLLYVRFAMKKERERKLISLSFRVRPSIKEALERLAEADKRSVASYVENLLERHIEQAGAKKT